MTSNQIALLNYQEQVKHNRATEAEAERSNRAKEEENYRSNLARETEQTRSNKESEALGWYNAFENVRSHQANEQLSRDSLSEDRRHHQAQEYETSLHNRNTENIQMATAQNTIATNDYYAYLAGQKANYEIQNIVANTAKTQAETVRTKANTSHTIAQTQKVYQDMVDKSEDQSKSWIDTLISGLNVFKRSTATSR